MVRIQEIEKRKQNWKNKEHIHRYLYKNSHGKRGPSEEFSREMYKMKNKQRT